MAGKIASALLIGTCCLLLYAFGNIAVGYLGAQNGRDHHSDVRFGVLGIEPACVPGYAGRIDSDGLTWCDPRQ